MSATFELAPEVERIAREIIAAQVEHEHLRGARILYLLRRGTWTSRGKVVFGRAKKLTGELLYVARQLLIHQIGAGRAVEGADYADENGDLQYDFALEINRDFWPKLTDLQRRAIIDHELCHCIRQDKGWAITGHDVEGFGSNIRRYGLYMEDLAAFGKAVRQAPDQLTLEDLTAQQVADAMTLPAGLDRITVRVGGETAEVTRRPETQDGEQDGPLYRRYFCLECRKRVESSEVQALAPRDGATHYVHATVAGGCGGPVFMALPGEPDPDLEAAADDHHGGMRQVS